MYNIFTCKIVVNIHHRPCLEVGPNRCKCAPKMKTTFILSPIALLNEL